MTHDWRVVTYVCPYLAREVSEVWAGPLPCVPINVHLRFGIERWGWKPTTVKARAYRLLELARALDGAGLSFWTDSVRRGGRTMVEFRDTLIGRAHAPLIGSENARRTVFTSPDATPMKLVSAADVMGAVLGLCGDWIASGEKPLVPERDEVKGRRRERRPAAFRISGVPKSRRGEQSLSEDEMNRIWQYWFSTKPQRPAGPQRPRTEWSEARRARWDRAQARWKRATAWWSRNQMLWALACTTGLRRWEIPGLLLDDVRTDTDGDWWVSLVQPIDEPWNQTRALVARKGLARFKTGGRLMYAGWDSRFDAAVKHWRVWRPVLVAVTGEPDHGMFLVNGGGNGIRTGAPLSVRGVEVFFNSLSKRLGPFYGPGLRHRGFRLSTHRVRHSVETLLRARGVPLQHRQRHLGHANSDTTLDYGTEVNALHKRLLVDHARNLRGDRDAT